MFTPEKDFDHWNLSGFASAPAQLFKTIESTHSLMKQQAVTGAIQPGTLFVADSQSAGRGRHERTWASPEGKNLYFNILIPLDGIPLNVTPQITQVAALTFAEVFRDLQGPGETRVTVKWPNDILFGKSKFCGILAEIVFQKGKPALNMGVGINVNSDPQDYAFLDRDVTTLKAIAGRTINREKLLQTLIGNLERAVGQFKAFGISPWVAAWKKMDQFIGARGTIVVNNRCTDENRNSGEGATKKSGRILDMQPDGSLLFQTDDGEVQTVYSADLEI
ncbi:BirA family biotin operon repressor/biotin-[acetyl-CoA-carboxylase] ligase [Fibrobacter sp. UWR4]|uniref:biotin--[acetyl-CoA-carboxylase] ligase n=1 Tax=Fibrobacter sp. UWR4 TaxID=1896218 RepID=UPI000D6B8323|nr:biotin--[acetyl-CoA-carboxylase] ligase [Fibrobacter sp. UWR4]PWJ63727.1 BirA family biotin operon repressor/biotin-[acetyl-CoA-carboxylase] ligase [Fibrobacter sp. UWR4]